MSKKINLEEIILDIYGCQNVEDFQKSFDISIKMIKEKHFFIKENNKKLK